MSEQALKRIKKEKQEKTGKLDLSFCRLKAVPEAVLELEGLQQLSLSSNQITDYSFLQKLDQLQTLDLSSNQITDISFLQKLDQLQTLDLSDNQITDYSFLQKLDQLQTLDLRYNQITDLSDLVPLLEITPMQVTMEQFGSELNLYDNPLTTPPMEIVKQGKAAILDWFEANKAKLNEVKLILIGDPKAGKTSILRRLKDGSFNPDEAQTDGINIEDIPFGTCPTFQHESELSEITGHFWDFGGQEIMNSTHQFFLTNRSVYLLVINARNDNDVSSQIRTWVQRIRATGGNSPIIVVANQIDINRGFGFANETILQEEFPQIKAFLKVSCQSGESIDELVGALAEWIPKAEMFETEIDERWLPIKQELEIETSQNRFLNESKFNEICSSGKLEDDRKKQSLITFLHDLGILLHFQGLRKNLAEYYVLDPYWITYGVYQILTSNYAGRQNGIVPIEQLDFIINKEPDKAQSYQHQNFEKIIYSTNERLFLVDILHEFKLCFYLNNKSHFIIPDLLETKAPDEITTPLRKNPEALRFVFQYAYLPKSVIPEIMVEAHGLLAYMWRTGCLLAYEESKALINAYGNRIHITVAGDHKKKREFMSIIRYMIGRINQKMSDLPKMLIPLPNLEDEYVNYKQLLSLEKKGERAYSHYSEEQDQEFEYSIGELLDGISTLDQLDQMKESIEVLTANQEKGFSRIEKIIQTQQQDFEYLTAQLSESWKSQIIPVIEALQSTQTETLQRDLTLALGMAFDIHQSDMDEKLHEIYQNLTSSSGNTQLKLKVGLPLLVQMFSGVNIEAEFDLKRWAGQMYDQYKLQFYQELSKMIK